MNNIMTQEEKDLLLKDLCTRLPYGVKVEYKGEKYDVLGIAHGRLVLCKPFMSQTLEYFPLVEEIKPYFFPLSSMTNQQLEELQSYMIKDSYGILYHTLESYDYLYRNNIDVRGLIQMGLAIDVTDKNIY